MRMSYRGRKGGRDEQETGGKEGKREERMKNNREGNLLV